MTKHFKPSRGAIVIERVIDGTSLEASTRFLGSPDDWLPGRLTMHGAKTFQARMRMLGMWVEVQFVVGTPWTRGTMSARRFSVEFLTSPFLLTWSVPSVDGELVVLSEPDHRPRLRFEGAPTSRGFRRVRRVTTRLVTGVMVSGIASRLSIQTLPPSRAWRT